MCTALISLPKYVLTYEYVTISNIEFVKQDKQLVAKYWISIFFTWQIFFHKRRQTFVHRQKKNCKFWWMTNIDPCIKTSITCIHSKYLSIHIYMFVTCIKKLSLAYIIMLYSLSTCIGNRQFNWPIYSKKEGIIYHFPTKEKSCSFFTKQKGWPPIPPY